MKEIINKLVVDLALPKKTIDAVVKHEFSRAVEAMKTNNSIEISGFGKFIFSKKRALMRIQHIENMLDSADSKPIGHILRDKKKQDVLKEEMTSLKIRINGT